MPFVVGVMGSFRSLAWQQRCFERTVERLSDSSCLPWAPDYRQNWHWHGMARLKLAKARVPSRGRRTQQRQSKQGPAGAGGMLWDRMLRPRQLSQPPLGLLSQSQSSCFLCQGHVALLGEVLDELQAGREPSLGLRWHLQQLEQHLLV